MTRRFVSDITNRYHVAYCSAVGIVIPLMVMPPSTVKRLEKRAY